MKEIVVSDHAARRYVERVLRPATPITFDLEGVKRTIARLAAPGIERGLCYYATDDGLVFIIRDGRVATVLVSHETEPAL